MTEEMPTFTVDEVFPEPVLLDPLIAQILTANAESSYKISQVVDADYRRTIARLEAKLNLIQTNVTNLCIQPWVPNPDKIIDALYPSFEEINEAVEYLKETN